VAVDVTDRHVDPVDNPWCRKPATRLLALVGMAGRTAVIRAGPPEHHFGAVEGEHGVSDAPVVVGVPLAFLTEAERLSQPLHRSSHVLVREHRCSPLHGAGF
jgi:hypothetical protein